MTNQLPLGAALREPAPESDLMTNLQWCCETNLFATEALAEILDVELPTVEMPDAAASRGRPRRIEHLVREPAHGRRPTTSTCATSSARCSASRATSPAMDEIGDAVSRADLDDLHQLLGHRPESWLEGEAELERFVLADADTGRHDEQLVALFHKRNLRAQMLLGPAGSAMARHLPIQMFRD